MSEFDLTRGTGQHPTEDSIAQTSRVEWLVLNMAGTGSELEVYYESVQTGLFGLYERSFAGKGRVN